jgi:hypothetical protein
LKCNKKKLTKYGLANYEKSLLINPKPVFEDIIEYVIFDNSPNKNADYVNFDNLSNKNADYVNSPNKNVDYVNFDNLSNKNADYVNSPNKNFSKKIISLNDLKTNDFLTLKPKNNIDTLLYNISSITGNKKSKNNITKKNKKLLKNNMIPKKQKQTKKKYYFTV